MAVSYTHLDVYKRQAETVAQAKQQVLVEEIRTGAKDILGEAVDLGAVNYDEGW